MHILIDVILVAVLLLSIIKHFRRGLMHTVYNIGKFIASVIAAVIFGKPLGCLLADGIVGNAVTDRVYAKLIGFVGDSKLSDFFANLPSGFASFVKLFGVDIASLEEQFAGAENTEAIIREMAETIAYPLSGIICAIIAYALVFAVAFLVLSLVVMCLKKIKIPLLTGVDKLLGLVLGLVLGVLSCSMIATLVYSGVQFLAAMNDNAEIMSLYYDSYVFRFIYELKIFEFIRTLI